MKHILLFAVSSLFAMNLEAQPVSTDENWIPTIRFAASVHDFGAIPEGPKAYHEFTFTNTGKAPILIENAKASCGCTVAEISKEPVSPGKTGLIKVLYNSEGRPGTFDKSISVSVKGGVNQDKSGTIELKIKGIVNPKTAPSSGNIPPAKPVQYKPVKPNKGS